MLYRFVIILTVLMSCSIFAFADDLDPHYKFSGVQAPASPYKNTWGAFQTDLFSGSFSYNYKIEIPPGTTGLAPKISLSYNSHSAKGKAGWIGAGWEIPQSYIQRNINYTRKDTYDDNFELYLDGAKYDLVYVPSDGRYHTKVESYLKVVRQTAGAPNERGEYWTVTTKDGTEYRFGFNLDSENILSASDTSFTKYVTRWSLDRIKDANGNCIYFIYSENPTSNDRGAVYLDKIEYNNDKKRSIEFVLESSDKPDAYLTIEQGSEVREVRRLVEILVKVDGSLVRKYRLVYTPNESQNRSLLASITQFGANGTSALPPVTFQYKAMNKGFSDEMPWATPQDRWIRKVTKSDTANDTGNDTVVETMDVNGDGLPDLVSYDDNGSFHWDVWLNTGTGFSVANSQWVLPSEEWKIRNANIYKPGEQAPDTKTAPMDMDHDGFVDIVKASGGTSVEILFGSGSGFTSTANWPLTSVDSKLWIRNVRRPDNTDANVEQDFFDMNGDGLPDMVEKIDSSHWRIWRNTGRGFTKLTSNDWPVFHIDAWLEDFATGSSAVNTQVTHVDMNGDGLPDIVDAHGSSWHVWLNTGSDFIDGGIWSTNNFVNINDTTTEGDVGRDLLDINGDGMPDIVNPLNSSSDWDVYFNTGHGFTGRVTWHAPAGISYGYVRNTESDGLNVSRDVFDLDGDGLADLVRKESTSWKLYTNLSGQADLLETLTDTLGCKVSVVYGPSPHGMHVVDGKLQKLPFNFWVVTSLTTNNGITGPHAISATSAYSYAQGRYDFPTREFRGFGQVTETRADGSKVIHSYLQDEARKGKEASTETLKASTETLSGANAKYALTTNTWSSDLFANSVYISNLGTTDQLTYDGTAENPKEAKKEFQNYDAYGNAGLEINYGDTSVSGDETYTYQEFAINSDLWIVDKPKHTYITASAEGTKLRESWFWYDGSTTLDDPPVKGNLTKEEHWLDTGTNPATTYAYDGYGNRTKITDAENHATRMEYDATFNTFPIKTWNAKDQLTVKEFNPANGEVTQKTDPNGYVTRYVFDTFNRKTKEIKPYDSDTYPTTLIQYFLDGPTPKSVMVSRREVAGISGTLDTIQFMDGFGNLIQTKSEYGSGLNRSAVDVYYDKMGRVAKQSNPYLVDPSQNYSPPDVTKPAISYGYDAVGRPTLITNPDSTRVSRGFDHWQVTETDENGHAKTYQFDAGQRLTRVVEHNLGETYTTNYLYSPLGELKQITDHFQNKTFIAYDSLGRKKTMSDPDLGSWSYVYDKVGNLTVQTDARGITTKIQYDQLNRKNLIDYPHSPDILFTYDQTVKGTLSRVDDGGGTVVYGYDQRLRKVREERTMDNLTFTTQWGYDSLDRITSQAYPDGQIVSFNFNDQGKLDSIPGIVTKLGYNAAGQTTLKNYSNGKSTSYTFDPLNQRLKGIQAAGAQNLSYSYDNAGNIKSVTDGFVGMTETFGYDDLDRLTSAGDSSYSASYQYNAIGNMLFSTKAGIQTTYSYGTNGVRPHAVIGMTSSRPVVVNLDLDSGKSYNTTGEITLDNVSYGNPSSYMASESSAFIGASWQTYAARPQFTLSVGFGIKTVYFKVKNADGESEVKSAAIEYMSDIDGDEIPDAYDEDNDNDGMSDVWEQRYAMNPYNSSDVRRLNYLDQADAQLDYDGDGLTNYQEYLMKTNPWNADTDNDGVNDYEELYLYHSNPYVIDYYLSPSSENFFIGSGNFNAGAGDRSSSDYTVADRIGYQFGGIVLTSHANITVNPMVMDFGVIAANEQSMQLQISNVGTQPATIGDITMGGEDRFEFGQTNDGCSNQSVPPSSSCTVDILFMPTFTGAKNAFLTVPTTDSNTPSFEVTLAGIASNQTVSSSIRTLFITTAGSGSGMVECPLEQFVCNTTYQKQFALGSVLTLHANVDEYSLFDGWSGDCSGFGDCSLVMGTDKNITATFNKDSGRSVRIDGLVQRYFPSMLEAYFGANSGDIIKAWGTDFHENIIFDQTKATVFKGGFSSEYSNNTGMTRLHGSLTISKGSLTVENLLIQ